MPNTASRFKIKFNLLLDEHDDQRLIALAKKDDTSKARLCRRLIRSAYSMQFEHQPICSDGQTCRCPQAHIYAPSLPAPPLGRPADAPPPPDPDKIQ